MSDESLEADEIVWKIVRLFLQNGLQIGPEAINVISKAKDPLRVAKATLERAKAMEPKPMVIRRELVQAMVSESVDQTVSKPASATVPKVARTKRGGLVDYIFETEKEKQRFLKARRMSKIVIRGDIPLADTYHGDLLLVLSDEQTALTHGLHKFPAKFIPEIPRWPILKYSKEYDTVLDPFVGSGGTMIEARLRRRNSYGIDVHPLAQLVAKVAVTPLDDRELVKSRPRLLKEIYADKGTDVKIPDFPNRDYWFRAEVVKDLAIITKHINRIDNEDIRDFFLVCLSSIIRRVSNADPKFLYALAISKKMRELNRHRKIDAFQLFKQTVREQVPKMVQFSKKCPRDVFAKLVGKDAREMDLQDESIDLSITSPPYLNAVDYPRAHQLEMYWLGLWKGPLADLKRIYIGNEQVRSKEYSTLRQCGNPRLDEILIKIYEKDKKRSYIVYKFFVDMRRNFQEVWRVLKRGGRYVVVVGDNVIRKIQVPTHKFLMDVAPEVGFNLEEHFGSLIVRRPHDMRETEKIEADWVIVFKKEV